MKPRILVIVGLVALAVWGLPRLSSSWQLQHKQELLMSGMADRKPSRLAELVSDNYKDDWGHQKAEALKVMDNFAPQFLILEMTAPGGTWTEDSEISRTFSGHIVLNGKASNPLGEMIQQKAKGVKTPTTFTWAKEGSWPWSWRLVKIAQPEVATIPTAELSL